MLILILTINSPLWLAQIWNKTDSESNDKDATSVMPICGGTLISRRYVLSAAHCGISRSSYVTIGTTNLASPRERYNIKKVTRHPFYRYTGNTVSNDLAVIELAMEVDIDMGSIPLEMNRDSGAPQVSQALSVMGFGRIAYKWNKFVPYLIHVNVPVISMDVCRKSYKEALNATSQLCAGTTGCDSCSGDSGNPIYGHGHGHGHNPHAPQTITIYGVTSFGKDCGVGTPAVYARVDHAAPWIDSVMHASDGEIRRSQITISVTAACIFAICAALALYQNQKHQLREQQQILRDAAQDSRC